MRFSATGPGRFSSRLEKLQETGPDLAEFVQAGAQQLQSGNDVAALDDEHSLKAEATGAPTTQCMPCRMVEQHRPVMFRCSQITGQQSERARGVGQNVTQRHGMIGCETILGTAFGRAHSLIRKSLQPQDPPKKDACPHPRVALKTNNVHRLPGNNVTSERVFQMVPRAGQVAEVKLRDADHSLAAQPIVRVGSLRGQRIEPLR
jgi:hypothetical protein